MTVENGDERRDSLADICSQLTPIRLLATPGAWRLVEDEESLSSNLTGQTAEDRVIRNANEVNKWIVEKAQALLDQLEVVLDRCENNLSLAEKARIFVSVARFISPRKPSRQSVFNLVAWTGQERCLLTTPYNAGRAHAILTHRRLALPDIEVVKTVLNTYIRPLFSLTSSSSLNDATGRTRHQIDTGHTIEMEDEIAWKGGRLFKELNSLQVLDRQHVYDANTGQHAGIAAENVFYMCCNHIAQLQRQAKDDLWSDFWTLILPPLLQLLEDTAPRYRLAGSQILQKTLFADLNNPRIAQRIGTLLLRTGVDGLLRQTLEASLSFYSSSSSAALLESAAESYTKLICITTDEMHASRRAPHVKPDFGKARFTRLSKLIDDGVLRAWAYAPNAVQAEDADLAQEEAEEAHRSDGVEEDDLINASINIVSHLARPDELGVGIVRYLDVVLDFLTQQLVGVEAKIERWKMRAGGERYRRIDFRRETVAAMAIASLLVAAKECPAVETWCVRISASALRCNLAAGKGLPPGNQSTELSDALHDIIHQLCVAQPIKSQAYLRKMIDVDSDRFGEFLSPHIGEK